MEERTIEEIIYSKRSTTFFEHILFYLASGYFKLLSNISNYLSQKYFIETLWIQ